MVYGMQNGNTKEFQPFNLTFNLPILVSQVNKALWTKEMQKLNRFQTNCYHAPLNSLDLTMV